jgi:hypothetical protein
MTELRSSPTLRPRLRERTKIKKILFWPIGAEKRFLAACSLYAWFRRGDNRFNARGMHGYSDMLLFRCYDDGLKELPRDLYMAELKRDYDWYIRRTFSMTSLRSKPATLHRTKP